MSGEEPTRRSHLVRVNLVGTGLDIDSDELPFAARLKLRANATLVDLLSASRGQTRTASKRRP